MVMGEIEWRQRSSDLIDLFSRLINSATSHDTDLCIDLTQLSDLSQINTSPRLADLRAAQDQIRIVSVLDADPLSRCFYVLMMLQ